jgi:hypothetical protein
VLSLDKGGFYYSFSGNIENKHGGSELLVMLI